MKKFLSQLIVAIVLFCNMQPLFTYAQEEEFSAALVTNDSTETTEEVSPTEADSRIEEYMRQQEAVLRAWNAKIKSAEQKLGIEKEKLEDREERAKELEEKIDEYDEKISLLRRDILNLQSQLSLLDAALEKTKLKIVNVQIQVANKEQEIVETYEKIALAEAAADNQEEVVKRYFSLLYKQSQLYSQKEQSYLSDPSFLFSTGGVSPIIQQRKYLDVLTTAGKEVLTDLQDVKLLLDIRKKQLNNDQLVLEDLQHTLRQEQINFEQQSESKQVLLAQTLGEERKFQELIEDSKDEQIKIEEDVLAMQDQIKEIETKILYFKANAGSNLSEEEIEARVKVLLELGEGDGNVGLDWPVAPSLGLSAHFRDSGYVKVFGVPHNAIDIPTKQGTEIEAPADGYVTKVRDNGYGYSYITMAHSGGVMTLYGHVSKILVEQGDLIKRGDIIGLSGGAPGTKGAGWMTTGAHLHFEVFQDGKHVDPLLYLDTSVLEK